MSEEEKKDGSPGGQQDAPQTDQPADKRPEREDPGVKPKPEAAPTKPEQPPADQPKGVAEPAKAKPAAKAPEQTPGAIPAAGAAEAAPKPKAPVVKKPVKKVPTYEDLGDDALLRDLRDQFGLAVISGQAFLGQQIYTVAADSLTEVMVYLKDTPNWHFDYLVDLTALDYLGEPERFCLVYHLYSHPLARLIRVKSRFREDALVPSMCSVWQTANWMEREVYDMFGIEFLGHPDLKRILLPDDWHGYPLRKDYDIKLQDQEWIGKHLRIRKTPS